MLFSEPKIPQSVAIPVRHALSARFSALQRAENSSTPGGRWVGAGAAVSVLFSEPKIPQFAPPPRRSTIRQVSVLFSEPKIPQVAGGQSGRSRYQVSVLFSEPKIPQVFVFTLVFLSFLFQCSSASRKFLNIRRRRAGTCGPPFQCSSASRKFLNPACQNPPVGRHQVSVLFSEPKIPQFDLYYVIVYHSVQFQCSSASRKFLNVFIPLFERVPLVFQCSSASRKFLNPARGQVRAG